LIQKRTLAVLAVAAAAGAVFPFGLPKGAAAAPLVVSYDTVVISPLPIEQPGSLSPTGVNTVNLCVQPRDGSTLQPAGTVVYLDIASGLFTSPSAPGGGAVVTVHSIGSTTYTATTATDPSAAWATNQFAADIVTVGADTGTVASNTATTLTVASWAPGTPSNGATFSIAAALTATPEPFLTAGTCAFENIETNGNAADSVPVAYTGPNPVPINGRDVIVAAGDPSDFGTPGQCVSSTPCSSGTYVFSPVMTYAFSQGPSPAPIAPTGSLAAGASVTFTVTALDGSGNPVPGAYIVLVFPSAPSGSATAFSAISSSEKKVSTSTNRFGALNAPQDSVSITYTAANPLPPSGTDTIQAQNHPSGTHVADISYSYSAPAGYTPVTPFRICDTRPAGGGIGLNQCNSGAAPIGPITQEQVRAITVGGQVGNGVPASGVDAVVVNVTAIGPNAGTFLTLYPAGGSRPATSNLNPARGAVLANLVEVGVNGGKIDIFNDVGATNVAIDVEGYTSATSPGLYNPTTPVRVCDTRTGAGIGANQCNSNGTATHPVVAGTPLTFAVNSGSSPVPGTGVSAVVFNLTAIAPTQTTFVKAYAGGTGAPNASNVNLLAHTIVPNRVIVPVTCAAGSCTVSLSNSVGSVNVAVDIDGWFANTGPTNAGFSGLTPTRLCDTRMSTNLASGCTKAMVGAGHVLNINVTGIGGIPVLGSPNSPDAVVVNVTAVSASASTFVTVYPGPSSNPAPSASDLNIPSSNAVTNLVVVEVGADGTINLFNDLGNVDLIVDVLGYYSV
jgi:hypothetical protein